MSGYYSPWYGIEEFLFLLIPILLAFFVYNYIVLQRRSQNLKEAEFYNKQLEILKSKDYTQEEKSAVIYSFRFLKKYRKYFKKNSQQFEKIIGDQETLLGEFHSLLKRYTQIYWIKFTILTILGIAVASYVIRYMILWAY